MKNYLLERLREPSTWRGIILILTSFGIASFSNEQKDAIVAIGMALAGAGGLLPDSLRRLPGRSEGDNS